MPEEINGIILNFFFNKVFQFVGLGLRRGGTKGLVSEKKMIKEIKAQVCFENLESSTRSVVCTYQPT